MRLRVCDQCLECFVLFLVLAPHDAEAKELISKTLREGEYTRTKRLVRHAWRLPVRALRKLFCFSLAS